MKCCYTVFFSYFCFRYWFVPANCNEVQYLISTVSQAAWALKKGKQYELLADSGFDAQYNYDWCKEFNLRLTCPLNLGNKLIGERLSNVNTYLNLVMLCYLAGVYYNFSNGRKLREIKSLIA